MRRYRGLSLVALAGVLAGLGLTGWCFGVKASPPIVPLPISVVMETGSVTVTGGSRVRYAVPSIRGAAQLLADDVDRVFGIKLSVVAGATAEAGDLLFQLITDPSLDEEGYRIAVTDRVVIEATGIDGLLAGGVSLLQALSPDGGALEIPRMAIEDEPFRSFRALMIDVKNHWHEVGDLERFVELCRFYKIRHLLLHTGEAQWIGSVMDSTAGIPAATRARERLYTRSEIDGLIAYARARGVYLFPHNETTEKFSTMRTALQEDFAPSDSHPNWIQEVYTEHGIDFGSGNLEGLDGYVDDAGAGVDADDPDYWKAIELFTRRSYAQFAAGYADGRLPYYHMGPVQGEGGTHPDNAVKVLEILRGVDPDVKLLFWNGPKATSGHGLVGRQDETIVCFYSKQYSASDLSAYLDNDWPVLNSAWSPLYIVGEGVARTQRQVHDDWNTFRTGTDGFTGTFQYDAIQWEEIDTPENQARLKGGMFCTWEMPTWVHLDRVRSRLPAFAEHAWHHRSWPYPVTDYEEFRERYLAVDALVQPFLGLTPAAPTTPKRLKTSNGTVAGAIRVTWQGSAGFPDGYRVLRNGVNRLEGAVQIAGDLFEESYLDDDIVVNRPYYYWVKAFNAVGESVVSDSSLGSAGDGIARTRLYEPFEYSAGDGLDGRSGGEGWDGAWSQASSNGPIEIVEASLTYGELPVRGGALRVHPVADRPGVRIERELAETMGIGDTTLWLSFLVRGDPVGDGHVFVIPNHAGGAAVGKRWGNRFAFDNDSSSVALMPGQTWFVVVRYDFRAGADDLYLWINPPLSAEPDVAEADKTTSGVDLGAGTGFRVEVQGWGHGDYLLDELRMGDSWAYAIGGDSKVDAEDSVMPVPDPMTWNVPPFAKGATSITMLAATADDSSGVEYFFEEVSGRPGGSDSGWQREPAYTDSGLQPETEYTYRVKVRDRSPRHNETGWSSALSATTAARRE